MALLEQINPFNDFYYISCFYSSLFSSLNYYNKNIDYLISQGTCKIVYDSESYKIGVYIEFDKNIEEILSELGIELIKFNVQKERIQDFIKNGILGGMPIIIDTDWYYLSSQESMYQQSHRKHSILIYGFEEQSYQVIDQKYVDTLTYHKTTIQCNNIDECVKNEGFHAYAVKCTNRLINPEFDRTKFQNTQKEVMLNNIRVLQQYYNDIPEMISQLEKIKVSRNLYAISYMISIIRIYRELFHKYINKKDEISNNYFELEKLWTKFRFIYYAISLKQNVSVNNESELLKCLKTILDHYHRMSEIL